MPPHPHRTSRQSSRMPPRPPTPPRSKQHQLASGFSLLEIVLVLAIIGILMSVVAFNVAGFGTKGKIRATQASMRTIKVSLDAYHLDYSAYPPTLDILQTINPPLLPTDNPIQDGWKMPFHYKPGVNAQGQPYTLISFGGAEEWDPAVGINVWTMNQ